ncbi:hypothetical protein AN189_07285 [Loktanella sp. 3ANDIMAR09]|uniref:head decoration protein n=1 Tax=Loktanella sp. 3ANDIMAR09 TaxID=1225657 RepID=UPI0006F4A5DB|nr:head decoration protein [Loktanella sp. 3ANDIMAR09]KQI68700.1 hypothetical protein AN189_07285 [Loktanella sp. 3ANDIMAR09]
MAYETKTEGPRSLGFALSEAEHGRSRDEVTIASGAGILRPGQVLGKITESGKYVPADPAATDGSQVAVAVLGYSVDASSDDALAVALTRAAQLKGPELIYDDGVDDAAKTQTQIDELAAVGLIVR